MTTSSSIRPFTVRTTPQSALDELRRRVAAAVWPEAETVSDTSQGVQLATIQKLARYWAKEHDWRKCEAKLKALPHFASEIDGLEIHFIHVRSKHANALPVIVTHGWPGSFIEQLKIIDPLTNPTAQGGITPPGLLGIHTNMPATIPAEIARALGAGEPTPAGLSWDEKYAYEQLDDFYKHGLGYAQEMAGRPQTLYAIADSPVGLAAWILDHDIRSYKMIARVFDGQPEGLTRDDVLDNITLYWLTNTAVSSARLYWENKLNFFAPKNVQLPAAISVFPDEIYAAPRSWAEKAYPKLIHFNRLDKGGHFAAWEQPKYFVDELRTAFRSLRT